MNTKHKILTGFAFAAVPAVIFAGVIIGDNLNTAASKPTTTTVLTVAPSVSADTLPEVAEATELSTPVAGRASAVAATTTTTATPETTVAPVLVPTMQDPMPTTEVEPSTTTQVTVTVSRSTPIPVTTTSSPEVSSTTTSTPSTTGFVDSTTTSTTSTTEPEPTVSASFVSRLYSNDLARELCEGIDSVGAEQAWANALAPRPYATVSPENQASFAITAFTAVGMNCPEHNDSFATASQVEGWPHAD